MRNDQSLPEGLTLTGGTAALWPSVMDSARKAQQDVVELPPSFSEYTPVERHLLAEVINLKKDFIASADRTLALIKLMRELGEHVAGLEKDLAHLRPAKDLPETD